MRNKKGYVTKQCSQCKKKMYKPKYRVTCSSKCAAKYRNSAKRRAQYK